MKVLSQIVLLIGLMAVFSRASGHDFKMAIYEIKETEGEYFLTIKYDTEDLQKSMIRVYNMPVIEWRAHIEPYVRKHFYLKFNGEIAVIRFSGITEETDFITVEATLHDVPGPIKTIDAFCTSLIEDIEGHTNLLQVNLHDKKRYFKLDKDRIRTTIDY